MHTADYEALVGRPIRYYPLGTTHDSFVGVVQGLYETTRGDPLFLIYLVTRSSSIVVPAAHCTAETIASLFGYLPHFLVMGPGGLLGIILEEVREETSVQLRIARLDGTPAVIPADMVEKFILPPLC